MPPVTRSAKRHKVDPSVSDAIGPGPFYKILNSDLVHYGFTYREGLNVDVWRFDPEKQCGPGGLYFSDVEHLPLYLSYGPKIGRVRVPPEAHWMQTKDGCKYKADRIILSDIQLWSQSPLWHDPVFCLAAVQHNGWLLQHVKYQTEAICMEAVSTSGLALKYVQHQTEAVCLAAVQQDGCALKYVQHQTEAICMAAVQQDGLALEYVQHPTEAICMAAVQRNGYALRYVQNQTEAICLAAVQQDGLALEYVQHPTETICLAAIQRNSCTRHFVKHPTETIQCLAAEKGQS